MTMKETKMDISRKKFIRTLAGLISIPMINQIPTLDFHELDDDKDYILSDGKGTCFIQTGKEWKWIFNDIMKNQNHCNILGQTMEQMSQDGWFFLNIKYSDGKLCKHKIILMKNGLLEV